MAKTSGPPIAALKKFEEAFAKSFGPGAIVRATEAPQKIVHSTGSIAIDYALGIGGWVGGRLIELWGPEQTGKTTTCLISIANAQRRNPDRMCGFIDVEGTFDANWAEAHGVDTARLWLAVPTNAEDSADMLKVMVDTGLMDIIVFDSIGNMVSKIEKEKDAEEATVAIVAKITTRMVKIASSELPKHDINQVRANLKYGGDLARSGGFSLTHVTTHRLKFRRTATKPYFLGTGDSLEQVGQEIAILVEKNKVGAPRRTAIVTFFNQETDQYGPVGFDKAFDAFTMGNQTGIFGRRGSWYDLPDGSEHNGKDSVLTYLRANPQAIEPIREKVLATIAHEIITNPMKEG
jgi:recombination protein RecA